MQLQSSTSKKTGIQQPKNRNNKPIPPDNNGTDYLVNLSRNSSGDSCCSEEKNLEKLDESV